jgi:hypothetical protein
VGSKQIPTKPKECSVTITFYWFLYIGEHLANSVHLGNYPLTVGTGTAKVFDIKAGKAL